MSITEAFLRVFAGLGFYFFGFGLVRMSVQQLTSRKVREFLRQATNHPAIAALWGFISGAVTQSSIAVSVILGGLVARGVTSFKRAAPIVAWSNLGLIVFVFFTTLDIHLFALGVIGFAGIAMNFNFFPKYRNYLAPAFGVSVALLAMWFMKSGLGRLAHHPDLQSAIGEAGGSLWVPFLVGAGLRTLVQSNSAVAVIGVVLGTAGVFTERQAMMVIFGSGFGTGTATWLVTSHLKGGARQITLFEALINGIASVCMMAIFIIAEHTQHHGLSRWVEEHSGTIEARLAWVFFFQQVFVVLAAYAVVKLNPRVFEKWAPLPPDQDLSRVRYLEDRALEDPETAIDLAQREELRIVNMLPDMIDAARLHRERPDAQEPAVLHAAAQSVNGEIASYIGEIVKLRMSELTTRRVLRLQQRHGSLTLLEEMLFEMTESIRQVKKPEVLVRFCNSVVEGTDTVITMFAEVFESRNAEDLAFLLKITEDRGGALERLRNEYLDKAIELDAQNRSILMSVMSQYERVIWIVSQLTLSLKMSEFTPGQTHGEPNAAPAAT